MATPLSKTGYLFTGWNTIISGSLTSGTHYDEGESITIGYDDLDLYAEWTAAGIVSGAIYEFQNAIDLYDADVCAIDSTRAIVAYDNYELGGVGYAQLLTVVSGSVINSSSPIQFVTGETYGGTNIEKISSTKAIIGHWGNASGGRSKSTIIELVSGTTLVAGTPYNITAENSNNYAIAVVDETKAIQIHCGNSFSYGIDPDEGIATVLNISGSVITGGSSVVYAPSAIGTYKGDIEKINSTTFVASYRDDTTPSVKATLIHLTGSTLTAETPVTVVAGYGRLHSLCAMSDSMVLLACSDVGYGIKVYPLSISGNIITPGTALVVDNAGEMAKLQKINSNYASISYYDFTTKHLNFAIVSVFGTTVSLFDSKDFGIHTYNIYGEASHCSLSEGKKLLVFKNFNADKDGYTVITDIY